MIGLGVGEQHAEAYAAHPDCELAAICDFDPARLDDIGERFPSARRVADAEAVLTDPEIDAVSIASYDDHHYAQAKLGIENGKHLFVEKPLCLQRDHADELHGLLAARPDLSLSSNLPLRRSPRFAELRHALRSGDLGDPYYLEADYEYGRLHKITGGWRGDLDHYSVTLGGGVHVVDLLLWLTGKGVTRVQAAGNGISTHNSGFRFDDFVVALLEFDDELIGKVTANFGCVHPHFHAVKVFGTKGTFVNGLERGTAWRAGASGPVATPIETAYPGVHKGALIASFVDSIMGDGDPEVDAKDVFKTLSVCFAIDEALACRGPVEPRPFG